MKRLLIVLALSSACLAQPSWTGILSSSRALDWTKAGLPGSTLPNSSWTRCGSLIAAGASAATINAALSACTANHYVELGAGTFTLNSGLLLNKSNIELRGQGANQTFIVGNGSQSGAAGCFGGIFVEMQGSCSSVNGQEANVCDWTAGYAQGGTTITLANCGSTLPPMGAIGNLKVGGMLYLDQLDEFTDNGQIWNCAQMAGSTVGDSGCAGTIQGGDARVNGTCGVFQGTYNSGTAYTTGQSVAYPDQNWPAGASVFVAQQNSTGQTPTQFDNKFWQICHRSQQQHVTVASCDGNTTVGHPCASGVNITITPGLYMPNWSSGQKPQAFFPSDPISNSGLSNFSIDNNTTGASGILIGSCISCWVSGIRSLHADRSHVRLAGTIHNLVNNSYFYQNRTGGSVSYGAEIQMGSDNLIENNIFEQVTDSDPSCTGACEGNVVDYNYNINNEYAVNNYIQPGFYLHASGSAYNLWEGNIGIGYTADMVHGTHHFDSLYRNVLIGWQSVCQAGACLAQTIPVALYAGSRYLNIVGNVLGQPGYHNTYTCAVATANTFCSASYQVGGADKMIYELGNTGAGYGGQKFSFCTSPSCSTFGNWDVQTGNYLMRWGNYDTVNNALQWNTAEVPSGLSSYANAVPTTTCTSTLACPNSFFYSSKPSWFGSAVWPVSGPSVSGGSLGTCGSGSPASYVGMASVSGKCGGGALNAAWAGHANPNPAMLCYLNTMGGPPDGSGAVLTFNANNCFATTLSPPVITTSCPLPNGTQNVAYSQTMTATGSPTITWDLSAGAFPAGISMDTAGNVTGTPTGNGTSSFTLRATNSQGNNTKACSLTINATVPAVSISPTSIAFGSQLLQNPTAPTTVSIQNVGSAAVTFTSITITGTNPGDFSINSQTCSGSLAIGATCTFKVVFTPQALGARSASVSIADNVAGSPQTVPLTGTGIGPVVSLNPTSIAFGSQLLLNSTAATTVTLQNTGTATLTITVINLTGTNPSDFSIVSQTCGSTLAPSASCTFGVVFTPTQIGARSALVTMTDSAPGSPHTIPLSGTGAVSSVGIVWQGTVSIQGSVSLGAPAGSQPGGGGGPLTYSARIDRCFSNASCRPSSCDPGCNPALTTGESVGGLGAPLVYTEGNSDPVPFQTLASGNANINSCWTDPDFGTYECFVTDQGTVKGSPATCPADGQTCTTPWSMGSDGGYDAFSSDGKFLIVTNSGSVTYLIDVVPSRFHAHNCSQTAGQQCFVQSQIHGSATPDSTHFDNKAALAFSRIPSDPPGTMYEQTKTQIKRLTITQPVDGSGTPTGADTIVRTTIADFVTSGLLPSDYVQTWNGGFTSSLGGGFTMAEAGGGSYQAFVPAGSTSLTPDVFIMPTHNNPGGVGGNWMFQASTGTTAAVVSEPNWNAICPLEGSFCMDGTVKWTNIGNITTQGKGFDVMAYDPSTGTSRVNTRLMKIYRGTGNPDPTGLAITDDYLTCDREGNVVTAGTGPRPCPMTDIFALHAASQNKDANFATLGGTVGGGVNGQFPGVGSCVDSGRKLNPSTGSGRWSSTTAYAFHDLVYDPFDENWYDVTCTVVGNCQSGTITSATPPHTDTAHWTNDNNLCYGYIWQKHTLFIRPLIGLTQAGGGGFSTDGHNVDGFKSTYRGGQLYPHAYSQPTCNAVGNPSPSCVGNGAANPGVPVLQNVAACNDSHPTYQNTFTQDLQPVIFPHADVPAWPLQYVCANYNEENGDTTDGSATQYRFGHNWNTGSNGGFGILEAIGVGSQQGDMEAVSSDFMGTRGDRVSGATTCSSLSLANKGRGQYQFKAGATANNGDTISFANGAGNYPDIMQITGGCATTCTLGTAPNWATCSSTSQICTDGNGVQLTNLGPNTCRGDVMVIDLLSSKPAP